MSDVTEIQPDEQALVLVVRKRALDEESTNQLVDDVLSVAPTAAARPIVLDMSSVRFAPSVALGSLVQLSKGFTLDGRRFALIGVHERVMGTIRVTRLEAILEIHQTLEQVINAPPRRR